MTHRKIGIVIPCYDRETQLRHTLETITKSKHTNYKIIIIDDASPTPLDLSLATDAIEIVVITPAEKKWLCPIVPTNIGVKHLLDKHTPDIIVIQSAECYYVGDVLMYANDHITDDNYIAFGCVNLDRQEMLTDAEIRTIRKDTLSVGWRPLWYNHPKHNARGLHFCSAMSAATMLALNGLDERFIDGHSYADNDLVRRVKMLEREFIITEYPFVVHQQHSRAYRKSLPSNKVLYGEIRQEDNYRAHHTVTEDFS